MVKSARPSHKFAFPNIFSSKLRYRETVKSVYTVPTPFQLRKKAQTEKLKKISYKVQRVRSLIGDNPVYSQFYQYKHIKRINLRNSMIQRYATERKRQ